MNMFHNASVLVLFSLTCLLLLVPLSKARPTVEPSMGPLSISKSSQMQDPWPSSSHGRSTRALSRARASLFEKRTPPGLTNTVVKMKMLTFTKVGLITPVVSAARALEDFYISIATKAAGDWQSEPQADSFSIQEGGFSLSFSCLGDTIPWSFVKTVAERLWQCACLGMTDMFDAIFMEDSGKIAVSISLRLADGGSSSSDTQYREGSVPSVTSR